MLRFAIKTLLVLGCGAALLPGASGETDSEADLDLFQAFNGARAAISDLSGFCDRAPDACATGRELSRLAGERIGDGLVVAYEAFRRSAFDSPADEAQVAKQAERGRTKAVEPAAKAPEALAKAPAAQAPQLPASRPVLVSRPVLASGQGELDRSPVASIDAAPVPASRTPPQALHVPVPEPRPQS